MRVSQTSFLGGEVSPDIEMRWDKPFFEHGAAKLKNQFIRVQGKTETRPGTKDFGPLSGEGDGAEWVFSEGQEYLVYFGHHRIDIFDNITGLHVTSITSNVPWGVEHIDLLRYDQQLDTMIVTHPDVQTAKITRTAADVFVLSPLVFDENTQGAADRILQPHYKYAEPWVTLTSSATDGTITLRAGPLISHCANNGAGLIRVTTASKHGRANGSTITISSVGGTAEANGTWTIAVIDATHFDLVGSAFVNAYTSGGTMAPVVFGASHTGTRFRIGEKEVLVTAVAADGRSATAEVRETLAGVAATTDWTEQAFSAARGYPRTAKFFGDRLTFFGSKSRPLGAWLSKIGLYYNFDLGTSEDSDAIWENLGESGNSEIRHLVAERNLLIFGDSAVAMVSNTESTPLTPKNFKAPTQESVVGASNCKPRLFDGGVLYAQNKTEIVRTIGYNDVDQRYRQAAANLVSPHVVRGPTSLACSFAAPPRQENFALFANSEGTIACFVSETENGVSAWVPWVLGGGWLARRVIAVNSVVWIAAQRADKWRLLRLAWDGPPLDVAVSASSETVTRSFSGLSGLDDLAGEQLDGWSRGHAIGKASVSSGGTVTIGKSAPAVKQISVGFYFEQIIETLPARVSLSNGPSHGVVLGISRAHIDAVGSGLFAVEGETLQITEAFDPDKDAATFTGIMSVDVLGYDQNAVLKITVPIPQRISIRGITRDVVIGG